MLRQQQQAVADHDWAKACLLYTSRPTQYLVTTPPAAGDSYGITNLSGSFFVNEAAQVNFLTVFDQNSPVSDTATLTANSLTVTAGASKATIDYNLSLIHI